MQTYRDGVKSEFERLDSEDLADRMRRGGLTDAAAGVAAEVLRSRGFEVPTANDGESELKHVSHPSIASRVWGFVLRCVRGQESLTAAYWYLGALLIGVGFVMLVLYEALRTSILASFIGDALAVAWILASLTHGIAVWRCANNASVYAFRQLGKIYAAIQLGVWLVLLPVGALLQLFGKS